MCVFFLVFWACTRADVLLFPNISMFVLAAVINILTGPLTKSCSRTCWQFVAGRVRWNVLNQLKPNQGQVLNVVLRSNAFTEARVKSAVRCGFFSAICLCCWYELFVVLKLFCYCGLNEEIMWWKIIGVLLTRIYAIVESYLCFIVLPT